jgi:hypothetical protein
MLLRDCGCYNRILLVEEARMARKVYDADRGIAGTQRYYDGLPIAERDRQILAYHQMGYSQARIAKHFGMTQQGISKALRRIAEGRPGRDFRAE